MLTAHLAAGARGCSRRWRFLLRRARALALLCVLGLLLPLLTHPLAESEGRLAWVIDLASHWQWLFLYGLALCGGLAGWLDRRWAFLLLAIPLPWFTASARAPEGTPAGDTFTVASANVNLDNHGVQPLAAWLAEVQSDIVVLLEVSPDYAAGLRALTEYPFRHVLPEEGPFGIALLSRHPLANVKVMHDADGIAEISARVQWHGRTVGVVAVHPMPPISSHYHTARNAALRALAVAARRSGVPTVVAGDLNATPWSSAFSGLDRLGLRRAGGLVPSWPAAMRGLAGIPIDHVLVTEHWVVDDSLLGPDLGSDHLPVLARLMLRGKAPSKAAPVR